jgi:hypothetical protein
MDLSKLTDAQLEALYSQATGQAPGSWWGQYADGLSRSALSALPWVGSFMDNAEAAAYSLPNFAGGSRMPNEGFRQAYDRQLAELRQKQKQWEAEHPVSDVVAKAAGTVGPILATGGAAAPSAVSKAPPLLQRVLSGASANVIPGMVAGVGYGDAPIMSKQSLSNALSGGIVGAGVGGAIPVVGEGLNKTAESFANSALGLNMKDKFRKAISPGRAVLDYTTGVSPKSVENSANAALDSHEGLLTKLLGDPRRPFAVDIGPVQRKASDMAAEARRGIGTTYGKEASELERALTKAKPGFHGAVINPNAPPPAPLSNSLEDSFAAAYATPPTPKPIQIAQFQNGLDALRMKRDFGNEYANFAPNWQGAATDRGNAMAKSLYGGLDNAIDKAFPGSAYINDVMAALMPIRRRAEQRALAASGTQRAVDRVGRQTGALTAAVAGNAAAGPLGAVAALTAQEASASPSVRMAVARMLNLPRKASTKASDAFRYGLTYPAVGGLLSDTNDIPEFLKR